MMPVSKTQSTDSDVLKPGSVQISGRGGSRTPGTTAIVTFRNFANASKKE